MRTSWTWKAFAREDLSVQTAKGLLLSLSLSLCLMLCLCCVMCPNLRRLHAVLNWNEENIKQGSNKAARDGIFKTVRTSV